MKGFWSSKKYFGFLNTFKYEEEKLILDKYPIIEASGMRTVYNWLQYFSPEQIENELANCCFKVNGVYSGVAGSPFIPESKEFAVVAQKR